MKIFLFVSLVLFGSPIAVVGAEPMIPWMAGYSRAVCERIHGRLDDSVNDKRKIVWIFESQGSSFRAFYTFSNGPEYPGRGHKSAGHSSLKIMEDKKIIFQGEGFDTIPITHRVDLNIFVVHLNGAEKQDFIFQQANHGLGDSETTAAWVLLPNEGKWNRVLLTPYYGFTEDDFISSEKKGVFILYRTEFWKKIHRIPKGLPEIPEILKDGPINLGYLHFEIAYLLKAGGGVIKVDNSLDKRFPYIRSWWKGVPKNNWLETELLTPGEKASIYTKKCKDISKNPIIPLAVAGGR